MVVFTNGQSKRCHVGARCVALDECAQDVAPNAHQCVGEYAPNDDQRGGGRSDVGAGSERPRS